MPRSSHSGSIEKTGFISEFTIEINEIKDDADRITFFRFTLTDDIEGLFNPVTLMMSRNSAYPSDDPAIPWKGLPFSSVQVAAVSALKDAYINRKRVFAKGIRQRSLISRRGNHLELVSVTLSERSGPYVIKGPRRPVVDPTARPIVPARPRPA